MESGYFEYETGYLRPELCIEAQLQLAKRRGAKVQTNEKVLTIKTHGFNEGVSVTTDRAVYGADKLIIAAGSWVTQFLEPSYAQHFKVYRQAMFWFKIRDDLQSQFLPGEFPIFIWIFENATENFFYGFPSLDGETIKIASEQYVNVTNPEQVDWGISNEEKNTMYKNYVFGRLPGITNTCAGAVSCLYTTTPDSNFVIDCYPGHPQVIIASPCSGHGFKHSAAIVKFLQNLLLMGRARSISVALVSIDLTRNVAGSGLIQPIFGFELSGRLAS